jgi:flagellar hook assembly protein FlgD
VRSIVDGTATMGGHAASWDGRDDHGQRVSRGLYFVRLRVGAVVRSTRVTIID